MELHYNKVCDEIINNLLEKLIDNKYICNESKKFISLNENLEWNLIQKIDYNILNWMVLSKHKNITLDILLNNINYPWNWYFISFNPNLTLEFIKENINLPWDFNTLSRNKVITWNFVKSNENLDWNWFELSSHPNIKIENIKENTQYNWSWDRVSQNPNLKPIHIINYKKCQWNWYYISLYIKYLTSKHLHLCDSFIKKNIKWNILSKNTNIIPEIISDNINEDWDWRELSKHIDKQFISKNIKYPWNWESVSINKSVDKYFYKKYINKPWNLGKLSNHIDLIEEYIKYNWDYLYLHNLSFIDISINSNWNLINKFKCIPFLYYYLSENTSISPKYIMNNLNKNWNFISLFKNNFKKFREKYINNELSVLTFSILDKNTILPKDLILYICSYY